MQLESVLCSGEAGAPVDEDEVLTMKEFRKRNEGDRGEAKLREKKRTRSSASPVTPRVDAPPLLPRPPEVAGLHRTIHINHMMPKNISKKI